MKAVLGRVLRATLEVEPTREDAEDIQRRLLEYEMDPRNFTRAMRQANRLTLMRGQQRPWLTRRVV